MSLKAKKYNLRGYTSSKWFLAFFTLTAVTVFLFIIITNPVMSELSNLSTIGEIENELNRITLNVNHADDLIPVASYGSLNTKVMPKLNLYKNNAEIIEDLNSAKNCIKSLEYFLYFRK